MSADPLAAQPRAASDRILAAAFELFDQRGVLEPSVEDILHRAPAARATFYRCFTSKEDLVIAYLERGRESMAERVAEAVRASGLTGADALPVVFDVFEDWAGPSAAAVASFLRVLAELQAGHPLRAAVESFLDQNRRRLVGVISAAGLKDPERVATSLQILIRGAAIAALEGDTAAAVHARAMAQRMLEAHRAPSTNAAAFVDGGS